MSEETQGNLYTYYGSTNRYTLPSRGPVGHE